MLEQIVDTMTADHLVVAVLVILAVACVIGIIAGLVAALICEGTAWIVHRLRGREEASRVAHNHEVGGSSPSRATNFPGESVSLGEHIAPYALERLRRDRGEIRDGTQ